MGINDGVLVYYPLAEIQLRSTDRLHCQQEEGTTKESSGGITS